MGERVLGFSILHLDPKQFDKDYIYNTAAKNFPLENMTFVGMMSLIDPPRPGVPEAGKTSFSSNLRTF
jgi:sodium/potassium-transporting ATPase subunit alpha